MYKLKLPGELDNQNKKHLRFDERALFTEGACVRPMRGGASPLLCPARC